MAYTVYNGDRCIRSAFDNGRCALTDGHHGLHTTAAGGRFSTQGGKYLSGDPLRRPMAGQKVTVETVSESVAAAALSSRIDVLREATLMNVEQLSERIERLERQLAGGTLENHRVRLERLEQDLRDTHDLAERAATAHLERKPEQWNADSAEPPRGQTYEDKQGDLWQCRNGRWFCVRTDSGWSHGSSGLLWPFGDDCRLYFPWKVWTNG